MTGLALALAPAAILAVAGVRGSRATARALRAMARRTLASGICGEKPEFFHVTVARSMPGIVAHGLVPPAERGEIVSTFGERLAPWVADKVFLTVGEEGISIWEDNWLVSDSDLSIDDLVVLRVRPEAGIERFVRVDEKARSDVGDDCAFYVKRRIPPEHLDFFDRNRLGWHPLSGWAARRASPSGGRNVVAPSGYHRTALARRGASVPLRVVQERFPEWLGGSVLDYGAGRGADCKVLSRRGRAACYDPHHPDPKMRRRPAGTFGIVMLSYVLNVLPPKPRAQALREAARHVAVSGHLVVAVRGKDESAWAQVRSSWSKCEDGYVQRDAAGSVERFQRFFTPAELRAYCRRVLGAAFVEEPGLVAPSGTAMMALRRVR